MGKRKAVPAALHYELTQYSSLIRSLRTTSNLDVTSHITKPRPYSVEASFPGQHTLGELESGDDTSDESEKDGDAVPDPNDANGSTRHSTVELTGNTFRSQDTSPAVSCYRSSVEPPSDLSSRKRKRTSPSRPRRRDTWTRWPLLANDVYIPEWSLQDEIGILAANALKLRPHPPLPIISSSDGSDDHDDNEGEDNEGDDDSLSYLPALTNAASNYLSTILALLVPHTPNRAQSQQNRIEPIGWRAVLDMLSSCGDPSVANQKIINNVKTRMEALYGSSTDQPSGEILAAQRIQLSIAAKEKLRTRLSRPMEDLFSLAAPQSIATAGGISC
ncbi:hypothetical protein L208DRAFT_1373997 [Tricholoma matsutake]|nr:hypothetical protein L208DRAFT_1373997 [Tricholoma matsutake 945]